MRDSNPSSIHLNTCTCVRYYIYAAVYIIISHQTCSRYIDSCYPPPHSVYFMWIHHIHTCMLDHQVYKMLSLHSHIHQGTTHKYLRTHSHPHISQLEKSSTFFFCCMCSWSLCLCVVVVVVVVFFISLCYLALISNSFNFRLCATAAAASVVVFPFFSNSRFLIYYIIYWAAVAMHARAPKQMKSNQIENQAKMKCLHVLWSAVVATSVDGGVVVVFGPFHKKTFSFIVAHVCIAYTYWLIFWL